MAKFIAVQAKGEDSEKYGVRAIGLDKTNLLRNYVKSSRDCAKY